MSELKPRPIEGAQAERIKELEGKQEQVCKCDLRTRLVGDGCQVCNPKLAEEIRLENQREQKEDIHE